MQGERASLKAPRARCLAFTLALSLLAGCGYRPVIGGGAGAEKLCVVGASQRAPELGAAQELLAGVRAELAAAGALAPGDGFPRAEVELLRVDEGSAGTAVSAA